MPKPIPNMIGMDGSKDSSETFNKVAIRVVFMSRKNAWTNDVYEMLKERAMSSTEISYKLKEKHRYNPHARKVTLVLRGDKRRFQELSKISVDSSTRRDSHMVSLWGLRQMDYEDYYPYPSMESFE